MKVDIKALLLGMARTTPAFAVDDVRFKLQGSGIETTDDEITAELTSNGYEDLGNGNWCVAQSDVQAQLEKLRRHTSEAETCLRGVLQAFKKLDPDVEFAFLTEDIKRLLRQSPLRPSG